MKKHVNNPFILKIATFPSKEKVGKKEAKSISKSMEEFCYYRVTPKDL